MRRVTRYCVIDDLNMQKTASCMYQGRNMFSKYKILKKCFLSISRSGEVGHGQITIVTKKQTPPEV